MKALSGSVAKTASIICSTRPGRFLIGVSLTTWCAGRKTLIRNLKLDVGCEQVSRDHGLSSPCIERFALFKALPRSSGSSLCNLTEDQA